MLLQEAIGHERRPLSWVVGDQGVVRPQLASDPRGRIESQRERKRGERMQATLLREPNHV
jgi:NADH-quinone oxidoreductase subunit B